MVKEDPTMIFSVSLNQKGNGCNGSKAKVVSQWHRLQLLATMPYGPMAVPVFWGKYPRDSLFLFIYKKGKGNLISIWDAQGQVGSSNSPLRP